MSKKPLTTGRPVQDRTPVPNLREMRKSRNVSVRKLAALVGASAGTVGDWESKRSNPSDEMVETLAKVLKCKSEDLR